MEKHQLKETYVFTEEFSLGSLEFSPIHVRREYLSPVIQAHSHSKVSFEIHYTKAGRGTVEVNGNVYPIEPDVLYITGPEVVHAQYGEKSDPVLEYCLYLKCEQLNCGKQDPFRIFVDTSFWIGRDEGRIFPLLEEIIRENQHPQEDTWEMSAALLRQVIIRLCRMYREQKAVEMAPIQAGFSNLAVLIPEVEDAFFYSYRTLTLEQLSQQLSLSQRQTQRLLQSYFGKSFSQKKADACMADAAHYLLQTEWSITEISDYVGFSSVEHFSVAFKRHMGCTPSQYRKRKKGSESEA